MKRALNKSPFKKIATLPDDFYRDPTEVVAQKLLGKKITRIWRGQKLSGIIVETEAYLGLKDKAAHAYGGKKTERTKTFYLPGGHAYVYLIYGMYHCLNVICGDENRPEGVLIRALEPTSGFELKPSMTNGPGKLCRALKIKKHFNGIRLNTPPIYIEDIGFEIHENEINRGPRIGIDYSEEARDWPLRFWIRGNQYVSRK